MMDCFSADYVPADTPATPTPCRVCRVEMTPEGAGQYDRCPCCWSAMLAASRMPPGRMGVVTPMPNHVDHVDHDHVDHDHVDHVDHDHVDHVETRGTG